VLFAQANGPAARNGKWTSGRGRGFRNVERALRNHNVWLVLTYVGLILLMARTYS
jgi:hypothetical protein